MKIPSPLTTPMSMAQTPQNSILCDEDDVEAGNVAVVEKKNISIDMGEILSDINGELMLELRSKGDEEMLDHKEMQGIGQRRLSDYSAPRSPRAASLEPDRNYIFDNDQDEEGGRCSCSWLFGGESEFFSAIEGWIINDASSLMEAFEVRGGGRSDGKE